MIGSSLGQGSDSNQKQPEKVLHYFLLFHDNFLIVLRNYATVTHLRIYLIIEMAKYSVHFYIGGIIAYLHTYFTNLLVAIYLAPAQVAFFSMGCRPILFP